MTRMLISLVWNKILKIWDTLFELMQKEVKCSKNQCKCFLPQEAGAFENNSKRIAKAKPKIEKNMYINIYWKYLLCPQSNASGSFLETCINFVEQGLKFSHFEGSIIP